MAEKAEKAEKNPHIFDLMDTMYTALFGAHIDSEKIIRQFHERRDLPSDGFMFYELLLHQPLHMDWNDSEINKKLQKGVNGMINLWKEMKGADAIKKEKWDRLIKQIPQGLVTEQIPQNEMEEIFGILKEEDAKEQRIKEAGIKEKEEVDKLKGEISTLKKSIDNIFKRCMTKKVMMKPCEEEMRTLDAVEREKINKLVKQFEEQGLVAGQIPQNEMERIFEILNEEDDKEQRIKEAETKEEMDKLRNEINTLHKTIYGIFSKHVARLLVDKTELMKFCEEMKTLDAVEREKINKLVKQFEEQGLVAGQIPQNEMERIFEILNEEDDKEQRIKEAETKEEMDKLRNEINALHETIFNIFKSKMTPRPPKPVNVEDTKDTWLLAPFAQRLARKSMVLIKEVETKDGRVIKSTSNFPTEEELATAEVIMKCEDVFYLPWVYYYGKWGLVEDSDVTEDITGNKTSMKMSHFGGADERPRDPFFVDIMGFMRRTFEDFKTEKIEIGDNLRRRSLEVLFGLLTGPIGGLDSEEKIHCFLIPIASRAIFYGEILVIVPHLKDDEYKKARKELGELLARHIKRHYVPILALLHEHFYEKHVNVGKLKEAISHENSPPTLKLHLPSGSGSQLVDYRNFLCWEQLPQCNMCRHYEWELESDSEIEKNLHLLWIRRKQENYFNDVDDSLVFKNTLYASEGMIKMLKDIFRAAERLRQVDTSLPAVLVVGGPGSGKDRVASFLQVFSSCYRNGRKYSVNMASLKPDAIIGPTIVGAEVALDIKKPYDQVPSNLSLLGILDKIRQETINKVSASDTDPLSVWKEEKGLLPVLVLDELNSLHVEFQGILLRFLENAEIVPVGGIRDTLLEEKDNQWKNKIESLFPEHSDYKSDYKDKVKGLTDILVVGIMNEDPEELTRERTIDFITRKGGLVEEFLKEYLTRIRRLRPDLKARMIRNGKFILPSLEERKYDIPILFHLFVSEEITVCLGRKMTMEDYRRDYFTCHTYGTVYDHNFKPTPKRVRVFITPRALELLAGEALTWPGNVRQLQALSKKAAEHACEDWERKKREGKDTGELEIFLIREEHVEKAMEDVDLIPKNPKEKGL